MSWWDKNNLRLIQTNISELNADLDVDNLVKTLKEFSANVLLLNTGGIESFYPTELEYQYKSPYLKKDLVGEAVSKCHENGIKYMARFDFSKAHESIYNEHPEWFYQAKDGRIVNYNGMVHTCVNGYYQREYSLKIIEEVINNYPVDGIFFNMFGYQTTDYSSNYYGICHCENCKKRFKEMYGCELPEKEDDSDPVYQKYQEFKDITVREMLDSIYNLVKSKDKEIAISTYTTHKIDIVKKESNTELNRPYPFWLYSASENTKSVEDTWDDKLISNVCINAVGLDYRFMGVSKYQVALRFYEGLASGSGLDFCIIGDFDSYHESENFEVTKNIFNFHKNNTGYFGNFKSVADILLVKPEDYSNDKHQKEYRGIFRMLKEEHILFDVVYQQNLNKKIKDLTKYKAVILPGTTDFHYGEFLQAVLKNDIPLLITSFISNSAIVDTFNIDYQGLMGDTRSAYLNISNKDIFKHFENRDWIFIKDEFAELNFHDSYQEYLSFISPARFGPPEKVGGHQITKYSGLGIGDEKKVALLPWQPGYLYYQYGYQDHKYILVDILDYLVKEKYLLETNAPESVEIFFNKYNDRQYNLQFVNLSGFDGTSFHKPVDIHNIKIKLTGFKEIKNVFRLKDDEVNYNYNKNSIVIDRLSDYDIYIIETK